MKKNLLRAGVAICIIVLIIIAIRMIRSSDGGTPNQEQKGNPLETQP